MPNSHPPQPEPKKPQEGPLGEPQPPIPEESEQTPSAPAQHLPTQEEGGQPAPGQPDMTPSPVVPADREIKRAKPEEPPKEKKELFRREDVRTMQKDLLRLQEEEALRERERLSKIKTEEELKKERERIERLKKEEEERMFAKSALLEQERARLRAERLEKQAIAEKLPPPPPPKKQEWPKPGYQLPFPLPKRPSVLEKFLARGLVIAMLVAFWGVFITFWYWFLVVRGKEAPPQIEPTPSPPAEEQLPPEEISEEPVPPEQPLPELPPISTALITTDTQNIIEFSSEEELPALFQEAVKQFGEENTFSRLVFYNREQNRYLALPELLSILQVNAPPSLLIHLPVEFTSFVYTSKIANRFGFVAEISNKEEFEAEMLNWEATMEQDTENLFFLLGKREPAKDNAFKKATYRGIIFRYLSFPAINFGIVWAVLPVESQETGETKHYFAFTTSGESMMRVIDRLFP